MSAGNSKHAKVLLVGWDSAGWAAINPLLGRRELPNLGPFIETGVAGATVTHGPLNSYIMANSVATGKHPDKHGILGTFQPCPDGTVRKSQGRDRQAKALWEVLAQNGRRCNVVNFPGAEPAEETSGLFVSPEFFRAVPQSYQTPREALPGAVCPPDRADDFKECIVSLADIDAQTMALFVPQLKDTDRQNQRLTMIAAALANTLSVHAVALWLMENTDWDVTMVNYPTIEVLWGLFLRYNRPRLEWVDEREFDLFCEVGAGAVRLCDMLLGRLLELAGKDTAVMLYSTRSYLSHQQLDRRHLSPGAVPREALCRSEGIFAMRAAGVRTDELIHSVTAVDLCPTALYLSGVKPGADMDGRVLVEAFAELPAEVQAVESWDSVPPLRVQAADRPTPEDWPDRAGFFTSYPASQARRVRMDNDWNLARTLLGSSRRLLALPLLIRLYYANPLWIDRATITAEALFLAGQAPAAMAVMQPVAEALPDTPTGQFAAGLVALHKGQTYQALDLFEQAGRDKPQIPQLFFYLAHTCLLIDRMPRAVAAFRQAVEIDPGFYQGHLGLADALYRSDEFAASAEAALAAVGVNFAEPAGHLALGYALVQMGNRARAREAFQIALDVGPASRSARDALDALDQGATPTPLAAGAEDRAPTGQPPAASATASREQMSAAESAVREALQEVARWHSRFVEDLADADRQLDDYLVANAAAGAAPPSGYAVADVAGELGGIDWTVRPPVPADLPALRRAFEAPFTDAWNREVFLLHPAGTTDIQGAVSLSLGDDIGEVVRLGLALRSEEGGTPRGGKEEDFLLTLLLRAAVARAAAGRAKQITFGFSDEQPHLVLQQCLERLGFETTMTQVVYLMDGVTFRDRCLGLVDRYRQRKKISDDVRLVPLGQVPWRKVDKFLRQWFADGAGAPSHELSPNVPRVMLRGDEIVAAFVGRRKNDETFLVTRLGVVDELRGLWVTPWMLGEGTQAGLDDGHTLIEFRADEKKFPDFVKIARHMGAKRIKTYYTMGLALAAPWPGRPAERA